MRSIGPAVTAITWICAASRPLYAHENPAGTADDPEFEDDSSLSVPTAETLIGQSDGFVLFGLRGSAAQLELPAHQGSAASAVAVLSYDHSRRTFERRSLSWGHSDRLRFGIALGLGYGAAIAYEVGPLVATDDGGSGVFVHVGGEGDIRSSGTSRFGRVFAHIPIGFGFQREAFQVEAAFLPSLGGTIVAEKDRLSGPLWLRQRLRVRLWHVQADFEHGRSEWNTIAADIRLGLCAVARRPPVSSCTFLESFHGSSTPEASFSEVAFSIGIGSLWTRTSVETSQDAYSVRTRD